MKFTAKPSPIATVTVLCCHQAWATLDCPDGEVLKCQVWQPQSYSITVDVIRTKGQRIAAELKKFEQLGMCDECIRRMMSELMARQVNYLLQRRLSGGAHAS